MIENIHDWGICGCINCQSLRHAVEDARADGANDMRSRIIELGKKFGVPAMAIAALKALPLPEKKFK
jgi:hypothetical protein